MVNNTHFPEEALFSSTNQTFYFTSTRDSERVAALWNENQIMEIANIYIYISQAGCKQGLNWNGKKWA